MSVSGLKAELKFLASIFDKNHERFRIVSWKLDELHCQFLVPPPAPPGSPHSPPPPLTLHCNITVRRRPQPRRAEPGRKGAPRVPGQRGACRVEAPRTPGLGRAGRGGAGPPLSPVRGRAQAPARLRAARVGGGRRRVSPALPAGPGLRLLALLGPRRCARRREIMPAELSPGRHGSPEPGACPGAAARRVDPGCCLSPGVAG